MRTEESSSNSDSSEGNGYLVKSTGIQIKSSDAGKPGKLSVSGKTSIVTESEPGSSSTGISLSGVCDVSLGRMEGHASASARGSGYYPPGNTQSAPRGTSLVFDAQEGANVTFVSEELICTANAAPGQEAKVFEARPRSTLNVRARKSNMTAGQPSANPQQPRHRDEGLRGTPISEDGNTAEPINADAPRLDGTGMAIRLFEFAKYIFYLCIPLAVEKIFTSVFSWFRK